MDSRHLVIINYAGDYREAFERLKDGGEENYYAQRHSVFATAKIADDHTNVTYICCVSEGFSDVCLEKGLRAITLAANSGQIEERRLIDVLDSLSPTHLNLRFPSRKIILWARKKSIKTLVTLADSFNDLSIIGRLRNWRLKRILNAEHVDLVANHGVASALSLLKIGVSKGKVIAWDWPHAQTPHSKIVKSAPNSSATWNMLYVGAINEDKGLGDLIRACYILKERNFRFNLTVAGNGALDDFMSLVDRLGLGECVTFLGRIPNKEVRVLMSVSDLVVVPSRHTYPEGFPMTLYEALSCRTPIACSDHPMFRRAMRDGISAVVFPQANPHALAIKILALKDDPEFYEALSHNSSRTWDDIQCPVELTALVSAWVKGPRSTYDDLVGMGLRHLDGEKHRVVENVHRP